MGRRSLRKIDPALDLSPYLKTPDQLPEPWDPAALFGRRAPLEIDVGSGKGLFVTTAAESHPDCNFLGVEIAKKYARHAAARLAKRELGNAQIICGDAMSLFHQALPAASVDAVHVYFPDPWWKKRHHKRRVMNAVFLRDVERVLAAGGTLHFWTDVEEYFRQSLELIAAHTTLVGPEVVPAKPADHTLDYRTHFERRMRLHDEPVYRAMFRKVAQPAGTDQR